MPSTPDERITGIEMSLAHLQHDFDQLNAAVLEQQALLQTLQLRLESLQGRLDQADAATTANPPDERPPHY